MAFREPIIDDVAEITAELHRTGDKTDAMSADHQRRRERLLSFLDLFYPAWNRGIAVFSGYGLRGISITFEDLTDETLELAKNACWSFWSTRRLNRENRARGRQLAGCER